MQRQNNSFSLLCLLELNYRFQDKRGLVQVDDGDS
jgi:hypothetical protein